MLFEDLKKELENLEKNAQRILEIQREAQQIVDKCNLILGRNYISSPTIKIPQHDVGGPWYSGTTITLTGDSSGK